MVIKMKKRGFLAMLLLATTIVLTAACGKTNNEEETTTNATDKTQESQVSINIGTLKGPTSMGLVSLMDKELENYNFQMVTAADEISAKIIQGELDIATVPANLASILYNKTDKGITVLNINTLGVLYVVTADESISKLEDLKGKTVYMTGKGTTPEYALNYLLDAYNIDIEDINIEFKSEATEVAAILAQDENAIGILPQPFVTVALTSNDKLKMVMDFTKLWDDLDVDSSLVTGVTIVRNEFLEKNTEAVKEFMEKYKESVEYIGNNTEEAAALVGKFDIVKEQVALKAIPFCNITYIDGSDMKTKLDAYLKTLYQQNGQSVGGSLPDEEFYYIG